MTCGRLTTEDKIIQECGEQNLALSLDEQDVTKQNCADLHELFLLCWPCVQGRTQEERAGFLFGRLYLGLQRQMDLDQKDEANGRELNRAETKRLERREPLRKAALTHTVRV